MNSFLVIVTLVFPLIATAASGQIPRNEFTPTQQVSEQSIKQVLTNFIEAWNRHDAKAFSMVFAVEADFTNVRGVSAHGRTEIERFHAERFATHLKDSNQKITETKIRFITSDIAAVDARWEMTGAKRQNGEDVPLRKGLLNFIMTRQDGQWLIIVMHNMELFPETK